MKSIHIFLIFLLVALVQLFVPVKMILDKEDILTAGTIYKFRTKPIDPNDPFRGKYITLRYELDTFESQDSIWNRGDKVLVYIDKDIDDFAMIKSISKLEQNTNYDFVTAKVSWYNKRQNIVHFNLDFDRYYMDEFKAKPAEDVYSENSRRGDTLNQTYALIAVKNGEAVLKDVLINDRPIKDYVEKQNTQ